MSGLTFSPNRLPAPLWRAVDGTVQSGPRWLARKISTLCYERYRDWRLGVHTAGNILADQLGLGATAHGYEPADYRCLDHALAQVHDIAPTVGFLDYGAGKGRAVALAATRPFRRVVGVELSTRLCAEARANVAKARRKFLCSCVEILHCDAVDYRVPPDIGVVLLFNPFGAEPLERVLGNLRASLVSHPRELSVMFLYPPRSESNPLERCSWLVRTRELPTGNLTHLRFLVYEAHLPTAMAAGAISR